MRRRAEAVGLKISETFLRAGEAIE